MRSKNLILSLLLIVTIVFIGFVRFFLKRDTLETQNARLDFFSNYLEIQKSYVLKSYEQAAKFAFSQLKRDKTIKQLLISLENADEREVELINQKLEAYINPLFNDLKASGFSLLQFNTKKSSLLYTTDSNCIQATTNQHSNYDPNNIKPYKGFDFSNDFIGYKFIYPYFENSENLGCFEFGFDYHLIKSNINITDNNIKLGFIILNKDTTDNNTFNLQNEFQSSSFMNSLWVEHDFILPKILSTDKQIKGRFKGYLSQSESEDSNQKFSIYLNEENYASAISFNRLAILNQNSSAYLVSINTDHMLKKAKELNDAILIISLIIIILAMIGFSYLVINRLNILEQKRNIQESELNLKNLNQSKDKFFSIVAHDLKNPFNGIMGLSGYLYNEFENVDDEEKKEIINDINIASKNAFNLLQNLLEWTRTQSGLIKNVPTILEPKNIISISLETVTNLAKNKDITIIENYKTDEKGYADENLVATVIRNLTTNAIKFSPRNSTVEIIVNKHEHELYFCVKDSGIGLKSEEIDMLFRIDVNFHKRGTEKETGSGLGLKLCKEFVEYCGGRIWVVSTLGMGSSFFFTIPLHRENNL